MHTRRIAAFLLGAWLSGSLFMAFIYARSLEASRIVLSSPAPAVAEMEKKLGYEDTAELVRHTAAEQVRRITDSWELGQIALGIVLLGCLALATQRRIFPLVLCGLMLVMVVFVHMGVSPELSYRSREMDFPPGNTSVNVITRVWALRQVYFGVEIMKLLAGGLLASYLFVFHSQRRVRKETPALSEAD